MKIKKRTLWYIAAAVAGFLVAWIGASLGGRVLSAPGALVFWAALWALVRREVNVWTHSTQPEANGGREAGRGQRR